MKLKLYLLAIWLISGVLPVTLQGVELMEQGSGPGGNPKVQKMSIPPVEIEIESGKVTVIFTRDLGEVTVMLQEEPSGAMVVYQPMQATANGSELFALPAGTYMLTVTDENEEVITGVSIVIP